MSRFPAGPNRVRVGFTVRGGAQILSDLNMASLRLMTNNPAKRAGLEAYGLDIVEQVPLQAAVTAENRSYLKTKVAKMGHLIDFDEDS